MSLLENYSLKLPTLPTLAAISLAAVALLTTSATSAWGPDFTDMSRDAQRFQDNEHYHAKTFIDGAYITDLTPKRDVVCPHGYEINQDNAYSPLHLASHGTAYPQDAGASLVLDFYHVGQCEKDVDGTLHTVPFDMKYLADYNAYTEDQILSAEFEDGSRIGKIVVQKQPDGLRWHMSAFKSATLNWDHEDDFESDTVYVTLENFRVERHLRYRTPTIKSPS